MLERDVQSLKVLSYIFVMPDGKETLLSDEQFAKAYSSILIFREGYYLCWKITLGIERGY